MLTCILHLSETSNPCHTSSGHPDTKREAVTTLLPDSVSAALYTFDTQKKYFTDVHNI